MSSARHALTSKTTPDNFHTTSDSICSQVPSNLAWQAIEAAANSIVVTTPDGTIEWVNRAFSTLTGYSRAEAIGKKPRDLLKSGTHHEAFYRQMWNTILHGDVWSGEVVNRRKDGSLYTEEMTITPVQSDTGEITRFIAVQVDVTERKQAIVELETARARLEQAVEAGNVGLWEWDLATDKVFYAHSWKRQLGYADYENADDLGEWGRLIHPDDGPRVLAAARACQATSDGGFSQEFRMLHKDGTYRWILGRADIVRDANGKPLRMLGTHVDITEQKRMEAQLVRSQRMDSIAQLAAGLAHDFNNLLTVIGGYTSLAQRRAAGLNDTTLCKQLAEVHDAAERAASLTRRLLSVGRQDAVKMEALHLDAVVEEVIPVVRQIVGRGIEVVVALNTDDTQVVADVGQMQQIIMNLAANGRDAMLQGGKLFIATEKVYYRKPQPAHERYIPAGDYLYLTVRDTGSGMDTVTLEHIFEPFFTTKGVGKGTGLGLSTVHAIVQQSNGYIDVSSRVGRGTAFTIHLPLGVPTRPPTHHVP